MPVANLKAQNSADVMKPEKGNDSLDMFIRQAIGKEPFLSFSRPNDSPMQWIQLLHALDQQEFPGWPLLGPMKVQMQKCDKCSREFYSSINYRRHIRVHHRLKKLDEDSIKNRVLLREFWDKRSEDEMKEILSFKDVKLEDVTGSSIVKSLTTLIRKPVISPLPQYFFQAASTLLDIIQAMPSKFPLSSEELFAILDEASEKTFLSGSAVSIQKYIFNGEAGKIGLETKNLVACTSFLVEQKLVKAYLADKDAEALRCQKLLVEEEEAAQRRQAELLERKRQKKLRQKELRAKEQRDEETYEDADVKEQFDAMTEAASLAEQSWPQSTSDFGNDDLNLSLDRGDLHYEFHNTDEDADSEIQMHPGSEYAELANDYIIERQTTQGSSRRRNVVSQWYPPKSQRNHLLNGFHSNQNSLAPHFSTTRKHGSQRDLKPLTMVNGSRRWSRKPKAEYTGEIFTARVNKEAVNRLEHNKKHEVLIGSISVTLEKCSSQENDNVDRVESGSPTEDQLLKKPYPQQKHNRPDSGNGGTNRPTVKLWRPVSRNGSKGILVIENGSSDSQANLDADKAEDQILSDDNCRRSYTTDNDSSMLLEDELCEENFPFSSEVARAFLAERWKEAIAADHLKLVLFPNDEQPGGCSVSDAEKTVTLSNTENIPLINGSSHESNLGIGRATFKTKPEKGVKLKYIPKQRTLT